MPCRCDSNKKKMKTATLDKQVPSVAVPINSPTSFCDVFDLKKKRNKKKKNEKENCIYRFGRNCPKYGSGIRMKSNKTNMRKETRVFCLNSQWIAFLNGFYNAFHCFNWQFFCWHDIYFELEMSNRLLRSARIIF